MHYMPERRTQVPSKGVMTIWSPIKLLPNNGLTGAYEDYFSFLQARLKRENNFLNISFSPSRLIFFGGIQINKVLFSRVGNYILHSHLVFDRISTGLYNNNNRGIRGLVYLQLLYDYIFTHLYNLARDIHN